MNENSRLPGGESFDYIIAGAGCAGLSLLVHMIQSGKLDDKRILVVDKERKTRNDRTWCFWETGEHLFESIIRKRWDKLWFYGYDFERLLAISPYQYKMIRGDDFYAYCFAMMEKQGNIHFHTGTIEQVTSNSNETSVTVSGKTFHAKYIFNSVLPAIPKLKKNEYWLLQHFKGWVIKTERPAFNPAEATLMDFRVAQQFGTSFVYVMPLDECSALVEYTLFSKEVLKQEQYDDQLRHYLHHSYKLDTFEITEVEFGVIPMTNYPFTPRENNIVNIGTAGGQTKGSSGYTFRFIQKHSAVITKHLVETGEPITFSPKKRFRFYDSTLLNILYNGRLPGKRIFTDLFKKNEPQRVLRFLDNESSVSDELKIISSLPAWPFFKAALQQI